jgi:CDP-diacylglycerol--serine O-phosphatidyltransferase
MANWLKNNLPNFLTCTNLGSGIVGIFLLAKFGLAKIHWVEILVLTAGLADFLDGFFARLLKSSSAIGKDLDSLADGVTFGALPSLVLFLFLEPIFGNLAFLAALVAVFSAIRLAIFNNDTRQSDKFIGVPTPANGFFIVFLMGYLIQNPESISEKWILLGLPLVSAAWLVLPVPLIALKFKNFALKDNWPRYLILLLAIPILLVWGKFGISLTVLLYFAFSILDNFISKNAVQSKG